MPHWLQPTGSDTLISFNYLSSRENKWEGNSQSTVSILNSLDSYEKGVEQIEGTISTNALVYVDGVLLSRDPVNDRYLNPILNEIARKIETSNEEEVILPEVDFDKISRDKLVTFHLDDVFSDDLYIRYTLWFFNMNRREFLKSAGKVGVAILGSAAIPRFAYSWIPLNFFKTSINNFWCKWNFYSWRIIKNIC